MCGGMVQQALVGLFDPMRDAQWLVKRAKRRDGQYPKSIRGQMKASISKAQRSPVRWMESREEAMFVRALIPDKMTLHDEHWIVLRGSL